MLREAKRGVKDEERSLEQVQCASWCDHGERSRAERLTGCGGAQVA